MVNGSIANEAHGKLSVQAWTIEMSSERQAAEPVRSAHTPTLIADEILEPLGSSYECRELRWVPGPSNGTWIALGPWLNLRWRFGSVMEGSAISGQAPQLGQRVFERSATEERGSRTVGERTASRLVGFALYLLIVDTESQSDGPSGDGGTPQTS